ncbi:MAG: hypothetical protein AB1716_04210 [Planctomycetota bacterium]
MTGSVIATVELCNETARVLAKEQARLRVGNELLDIEERMRRERIVAGKSGVWGRIQELRFERDDLIAKARASGLSPEWQDERVAKITEHYRWRIGQEWKADFDKQLEERKKGEEQVADIQRRNRENFEEALKRQRERDREEVKRIQETNASNWANAMGRQADRAASMFARFRTPEERFRGELGGALQLRGAGALTPAQYERIAAGLTTDYARGLGGGSMPGLPGLALAGSREAYSTIVSQRVDESRRQVQEQQLQEARAMRQRIEEQAATARRVAEAVDAIAKTVGAFR